MSIRSSQKDVGFAAAAGDETVDSVMGTGREEG
jgi:hypothetical protein